MPCIQLDLELIFIAFYFKDGARSRDDLDLEQTIKSPSNTSPPDVIRSALNKDGDQDGNEDSAGAQIISPSSNLRMIDNLFGIPDKIVIPERYIPDTVNIFESLYMKTCIILFPSNLSLKHIYSLLT